MICLLLQQHKTHTHTRIHAEPAEAVQRFCDFLFFFPVVEEAVMGNWVFAASTGNPGLTLI